MDSNILSLVEATAPPTLYWPPSLNIQKMAVLARMDLMIEIRVWVIAQWWSPCKVLGSIPSLWLLQVIRLRIPKMAAFFDDFF